jgi:hypothetical protein
MGVQNWNSPTLAGVKLYLRFANFGNNMMFPKSADA